MIFSQSVRNYVETYPVTTENLKYVVESSVARGPTATIGGKHWIVFALVKCDTWLRLLIFTRRLIERGIK
jgi:hypothetical protein